MTTGPAAIDEVAGLCSDLIRLDTSNFGPSGAKGEREAAEYVATRLDEVGISSQIVESEPRRTTLVADWAPEGCDRSLPPLLIHGHTDVVPAVAGQTGRSTRSPARSATATCGVAARWT